MTDGKGRRKTDKRLAKGFLVNKKMKKEIVEFTPKSNRMYMRKRRTKFRKIISPKICENNAGDFNAKLDEER